MVRCGICSLLLAGCFNISFSYYVRVTRTTSIQSESKRQPLPNEASSSLCRSNNSFDEEYSILDITAPRWKMVCYDADDGVFGLDTRDPYYGVEIVKDVVPYISSRGLGLELLEYMREEERRTMTIIESITSDSVFAKNGVLKSGDTITSIGSGPMNMLRTEGLDLDDTMGTISEALANCTDSVTVYAKRLVKRATLNVTFISPNGEQSTYPVLAGSNLRGELIRRNLPIYDRNTKRFDQPFISGDCAGEGICATCIVECIQGVDTLSPKDAVEKLAMANRPSNWRLSCRTFVGRTNSAAQAMFRLVPQKEQRMRR